MWRFQAVRSMYYGWERVEGGFITTEWLTFTLVPLLPVASYLATEKPRGSYWTLGFPKDSHVQRLEHIYKPHILKGYSATGLVIVAMILLPYVLDWLGIIGNKPHRP